MDAERGRVSADSRARPWPPRRITRVSSPAFLTGLIVLLITAAWAGMLGGDGAPGLERSPTTPTAEPPTPVVEDMRFGLDAASIPEQTLAGVTSDYGTLWIGAWTLTTGWAGPDALLASMVRANITPAIHVYYWGDDVSQACLEMGCWSELHGTHKDAAGWARLIDEMLVHLDEQLAGRPVTVILASEFNKGDVQQYEPLDEALAAKADLIHERYPASYVVLGLGNWNRGLWSTWDRAAHASDAIGIQAVRAAWEPGDAYALVFDVTLAGAQEATRLFARPVIIHDIALSSLPSKALATDQADALREFFERIDELEAAGVVAMFYRSWRDTPNMDLANTFGAAERGWGLAGARGVLKSAGEVWITGVLMERAVEQFDVTFTVPRGINTWWIEVEVQATNSAVGVDALIGDVVAPLGRTPWGSWARSQFVAPGVEVQFIARDVLGQVANSTSMIWPDIPPPAANAFRLGDGINGWWIEVHIEPTPAEARANVAGTLVPLAPTDWGAWTAHWRVPPGTAVRFEADGPAGPQRSAVFVWP